MNIYRNRTGIKSAKITDGLLYICSKQMIKIFFISNKKASCSIKVNHTPLEVFATDNVVIYYTKEEIYKLEFKDCLRSLIKENNDPNNFLIDYKLKLLSNKKSLDCITLIKDHIFVFSDLYLDLINVFSDYKSRKNLKYNKGVCVKCVVNENNLYLGYEDGGMSRMEDVNMKKISETKVFETSDILKASMSIISFDIQNDMIAVSFIGKQIGLCNVQGNSFRYIEMPFTPKLIQFWKDSLVSLDDENNIFLLDFDLKIFYKKNYEGDLQDIKIYNEKIYLIYKSGTIVSQEDIIDYS